MRYKFDKISAVLLFALFFLACSEFEPPAPEDDEILEGILDGLSHQEQIQHLDGDRAFSQVFTKETGLGSIFVATSCISCHAGDGKGHPFTTLTRFGQVDSSGNKFLHLGGPQLQNRAIPGFKPETIPLGAAFTKLTPPINSGLGFIELVSDEDILAMSDPEDADGDGISGVPNWNYLPGYVDPKSNAVTRKGKYICRFGKKGSVYNLLQQSVGAYNQDIGISSTFDPIDVYSGNTTDAEVSDKTIRDVVFYLQTLKTPIQRNQNDPTVKQGKEVFKKTACISCHKESLRTGYSKINALSYKEFNPYTDLLLHDMGSELDDGYTEGSAKTSEWRTPPLWGLGLAPKSQGGQYFLMHDGRARTIEEAILMHNGEAIGSRNKYNQLTPVEKAALIKFLESL